MSLSNTTQVNPNSLIIDEASATVTYVGEAPTGSVSSGPNWRIKKITVSGVITVVEFADGNANFDNVWDDRVSLSYS